MKSCPYCRQDHGREEMEKLYEELNRESGRELKGLDLARAILRPRASSDFAKQGPSLRRQFSQRG
jgi:hypothetical protein